MGVSSCSKLHSGYDYGLFHTFHSKTPSCPILPKINKKVRDETLRVNVFRNKSYDQVQNNSKVRTVFGFPVNYVSNPQTKWQISSNLQSPSVEQISKAKTVSSSKPFHGDSVSPKRRFSGKNRPFSGLLPHPDKKKSSTISGILLRRKGISNDLSPIRFVKRASSFFKDNQLDSWSLAGIGYKNSCVPRRFSFRPSGFRDPQQTIKSRHDLPSKPGLGNQQGKSDLIPSNGSRVSRYNLERAKESFSFARKQKNSNCNRFIKYPLERKMELENCNIFDRETRFRFTCSSAGSIVHSSTSKSSPLPKRVLSKSIGRNSTSCVSRLQMVGKKRESEWCSLCTKPLSICYHGRFGTGMGCSFGNHSFSRKMDLGTAVVACKPKRTLHGLDCAKTMSVNMRVQNGDGSVRQPNSRIIPSKPGGYQIPCSLTIGEGNSNILRRKFNQVGSSIYSGSIQSNSGLFVTEQNKCRMASEAIGNKTNFSNVGSSTDRSICIRKVKGSTPICITRCEGLRGVIHKCVQPEMEVSSCLGVSSTPIDSQSTSSPELSEWDLHSGGPKMGQGFLEKRSEKEGSGTSFSNKKNSGSSDRPLDQSGTTQGESAVFGGLENSGWSALVAPLSKDDVDLLQTAWRNSTWKTYLSAWRHWLSWCSTSKVVPSNPNPHHVASYLSFLCQTKKLAYQTILVHKSVIVSFANPNLEKGLGSHPLVKSMLKAISLKEACNRPLRSKIWNIQDLIDWLKSNPPLENSIFQVSRHLSCLLLLASGRRVHDLTLLSIDKDHCTVSKDSIIFWPRFGSKTDNAERRQSGWKLLGCEDEVFNIVKWINVLIKASSDRRKAVSGLDSLFISTRGKVKAASRTVIAGWLKGIFKCLGIDLGVGSIRSAVASHGFENNISLDEILSKGNWMSSQNFFKHYWKSVEKPSSQAVNVLGGMFKAT